MKQIQMTYVDPEGFQKDLTELRKRCEENGNTKLFFQVYSVILDEKTIQALCDVLEQVFPDAPYMGCSTSGNIVDCQVSAEVTVVCNIIEDADTQVKILQYDFNQFTVEEVTSAVIGETKSNSWIKAM